jgi:Ankyrin repeats (3 copies)
VFCQLDTLRRCIPSSIPKALNELPITLDDTYTRALEYHPKEKRQHAHRLFQCLIAAIRPLRVEELAEIFAIQFHSKAGPNLVEDWRPLDAEDAVLSACSSLISIVNVEDSKIVQFSHFSVKEFLTSARLASSNVGTISHYHIPVEPAHGILARACLTVLLELDEKTDKKRLGTFPLAFYAAQNWVDHAKFGKMTPEIEDAIIRLFDPKKSHLCAWTWIHNMQLRFHFRTIDQLNERPQPDSAAALCLAAYCGFTWLAEHLIITHAEDINGRRHYKNATPLHWAFWGHHDAVMELSAKCAGIQRDIEDESRIARHEGHLDVMHILLEHGADIDAQDRFGDSVSHWAADHGYVEVLRLLLQYNANTNARGRGTWTPLHHASSTGHVKATQLLLEYGADVNARIHPPSPIHGWTPFKLATATGHHGVARLLLEHGAEVNRSTAACRTALRIYQSNFG